MQESGKGSIVEYLCPTCEKLSEPERQNSRRELRFSVSEALRVITTMPGVHNAA